MVEFDAVVFDVDGTLWDDRLAKAEFDRLLMAFFVQELSCDVASIQRRKDELRAKPNAPEMTSHELTRLFGLSVERMRQATFGALSLEAYIGSNPSLVSCLQALPCPKIAWTNAPRFHGERIIDLLGARVLFSAILGEEDVAPFLKPQQEAFARVQATLQAEPRRVLFVDNTLANVAAADAYGWTGVWIKHPWIQDSRWPNVRRISALDQLSFLRF